jgi:hypothetical protein
VFLGTPVASSLPDLALIISLNFLGSDDRIIATNPHLNSPGAAYLDVSYPSLEITIEKIITIPDQMASYWVANAPQYDDVIVINALQPNITVIGPETGSVNRCFTLTHHHRALLIRRLIELGFIR